MTRLLMATVITPGSPIWEADAEPITVDQDGDEITITLHDGTRYILERHELANALAPAREEERKAA